MSDGKLRLLDEPVEYTVDGEFIRATIYRTDPDTGRRKRVEEFMLTLHAAEACLYGPKGKIAATSALREKLMSHENVSPLGKTDFG